MAKDNVLYARTSDETEAQIEALAKAWGPVKPLSRSDVAIEAINRAFKAAFAEPWYHQGDPPARKKSRKSSVGA